MSSPQSGFAILNPDTPLVFLPPVSGAQTTAARYILAVMVGAWFWDVFMSIPEEVRIYRKRKFRIPDAAYFMARIASAGFFVTAFLYSVAPLNDCQTVIRAVGWFGAFAVPLNASLFLLRIWGVFYDVRPICIVFTLLWLATLASFTAPFTFVGAHIGPTKECIIHSVQKSTSAGFVAIVLYDTMVFIAISIRLLLDNPADGWIARIKLFFSGEKMGYLSRALLQTGQLYYLATVGGNIIALSVILDPRIPPSFKAISTIPNIALQNAMACRVFRFLKLGYIKPSAEPFRSSASATPNVTRSIHFNSPPSHVTSGTSVSNTYNMGHSTISGNEGDILPTMSYQSDRSVKAASFSLPGTAEENEKNALGPELDKPERPSHELV